MCFTDGWTTDDLVFLWKEGDPVQVVKNLHLPRFTLEKFLTDYCNSKTNTGNYLFYGSYEVRLWVVVFWVFKVVAFVKFAYQPILNVISVISLKTSRCCFAGNKTPKINRPNFDIVFVNFPLKRAFKFF